MTIPILETNNLILRPLRASDLDDLFEYANDPVVYHFGMWRPYESREATQADLARLLQKYENNALWWWALECKADGKMIGRCELANVVPYMARAEIGYALNQHYWGRGYATEALRRVLAYGWPESHCSRSVNRQCRLNSSAGKNGNET